MKRLRTAVYRRLSSRRHSALLAAIIAAFAVRPIVGETKAGDILFGVVVVLLLLVALYNINVDDMVGERGQLLAQRRRRRSIGWTLALIAGAERFAVIFVHSWILNLVGSSCWLLFASFVTLSQIRSVLRQREVTGETIAMAISVYLMLGFTWAFLYILMFQMHPDSFGGIPPSHPNEILPIFPVLGYFSLTTLSTIGFGDITPLTLQARYAAVAEGITGQFYMAILVARLVGIQMSHATSHPAATRALNPGTNDAPGEN